MAYVNRTNNGPDGLVTRRPIRAQSTTSSNQLAQGGQRESDSNRPIAAPLSLLQRLWMVLWQWLTLCWLAIAGQPGPTTIAFQQDLKSRLDEQTEGEVYLSVFRGSLEKAVTRARHDLLPLMVYVHAEGHTDTPAFCRKFLSSQPFITAANSNALFWCARSCSAEGMKVAETLEATKFPFIAVLLFTGSKWYALDRLQGMGDIDVMQRRIDASLAEAESQLTVERLAREERALNQQLRAEQDTAYEEALREDRRKEQERRKVLEAQQRAEDERQREEQREREKHVEELRRIEAQKLQRQSDYNSLPTEPEEDRADTVTVVFKMPNGDRLLRRFSTQDKVMHLYHYVAGQSQSEPPTSFQLSSHYPRRDYIDQSLQLDNAGIEKRAMLFVQDLTQ